MDAKDIAFCASRLHAARLFDRVNGRAKTEMRTMARLLVLWVCSLGIAHAGQVLAPTIVSPLNAVGQVNAQFLYKFVATGDGPIVFSATGLPEGLVVSDDTIAGAPTEFGSFVVTIQAANLVGADVDMLTLDIQPLAAPGGSLSNTDRDGDGYSDELEIALSSSPSKQSSKPLGGPVPADTTALKIERLTIKFNFLSDRRDNLNCKGRLIVGDNALRGGEPFVLDVAGVIQAASLDSRGNGTETEEDIFTFRLRLPRSGATGVTRIGKFNMSIRQRSFFNQFTDEGLTKTTSGTYTLPVMVIFDGKLYKTTVLQTYAVKANRAGATK